MLHLAVGGVLVTGLLAGPDDTVVIPQFDEAIPVPVQGTLTTTMKDSLGARGLTPQVADDVDCDGASCAAALNGKRGVAVRITLEARDYTVTARAMQADGTVIEEATRVCRICTHDELEPTVTEAVEAVAPALEAPLGGTLSVVSNPPGAQVSVDGEPAGTTPIELTLPPGPHEVSVEAEGREAQARSVSVADGEVTREAFELGRAPIFTPRTEELMGWGAVALGAAAIASGVALLIIDEREIKSECSGADQDPQGNCRFLYDTVGAGAGLLAVGVVAGAGGGVLVWHGRKRRREEPSATARIGVGGIVGRF